MRPIVIQSHERPLTQVKYNKEGDLLFTCAKDKGCPVALFYADDGERIGTYDGHDGAVFCLDVTRDSKWLLTAGADSSVRLWDVEKGAELYRVSRVLFTDQDKVIVTVGEDGFARRYDVESGKMLAEEQIHTEMITDMQASPDGSHAVTSSKDKTAKIIDLETLQVLRTYKNVKPCNSAAMSPLNHVAVVGGQDAANVTTTADAAGGFETRFFHKLYEEEFGNVRGHFGPVNSIAISPDGKAFTTGGEDGFVRMQHFDMDYLTTNFFIEA